MGLPEAWSENLKTLYGHQSPATRLGCGSQNHTIEYLLGRRAMVCMLITKIGKKVVRFRQAREKSCPGKGLGRQQA